MEPTTESNDWRLISTMTDGKPRSDLGLPTVESAVASGDNGHSDGPDDVFQLFALLKKQPIVAELRSTLGDGKPAVFRMSQPPPAVWALEGRSFPLIVARAASPVEDPGSDADYMVEHHDYSIRMLQRAIVSAQAVVHNPDGTTSRDWVKVRLVAKGATPGPGEISMDDFDQYTNVQDCFTVLINDFNNGGVVGRLTQGQVFRGGQLGSE